MSELTAPHFQDAEKAREYLESIRWPDGPVCPHCGSTEPIYRVTGKSARPGLIKCGSCKKQFTVTVGTVFERSKIPLHKWLMAAYLLCSSKKGISSHQLHRTLGVTYKTAWFMSHRIREAMREPNFRLGGGEGSVVEADETYVGGRYKNKPKSERMKPTKTGRRRTSYHHMEPVISLVERGGKVRSVHVQSVTSHNLQGILWSQLDPKTTLMTDEAGVYTRPGRGFARHGTVNHSADEYVRGDVHTNTVESYFALLKRGLIGVYQHCGSQHLKRYVGEFDFRYNHRDIDDASRTVAALRGIEGKRLTYQQPR